MQLYACKFCIARYGLKGSEVDATKFTDEEWERVAIHIERDHGFPVPRDHETEGAAAERVAREYGVSIANPSFVLQELYGHPLTQTLSLTALVIRCTGPIIPINLLKEIAQ